MGAPGGFPVAWNSRQLPSLRRRARGRGGKGRTTRASRLLTCSLRLPRPQRAQREDRAPPPAAENPGSSLGAGMPEKGGPFSDTCLLLGTSRPPTPVDRISTLLPPREQSRLTAKLEISNPFLDSHQLLFRSIFTRNSARPKPRWLGFLSFFFLVLIWRRLLIRTLLYKDKWYP